MEGEIAGKREGRKEGRKKEGKTEEGQKEGSFLLVNKRNKLNTAQSIKIPSHYPVDLALQELTTPVIKAIQCLKAQV